MSSSLTDTVQKLLDDAVSDKVALGLAAAVFDSKSTFASAASGPSSVKNPDQAWSLDTTFWPASSGKPLVSLLALILAERDDFDLDSHDQLVKVVPELGKDWPGTRIWQIIVGQDADGNYTFREAKVGITLRHLLTHSIGSGLPFIDKATNHFEKEWNAKGKSLMAGDIEAFNHPRQWESGEQWAYGLSAEWLGVFVTRLSGTTFRQAARELLYEPLGLEKDTIDTFRTPKMNEDLAEIVAHLPDNTFVSLPTPFDTAQYEGEVPEGKTILGNAPFWCTLRTYAQILRSFLNKSAPAPGGKPLLSERLWEEACVDDFKKRGVSITQDPFFDTADPAVGQPQERFTTPTEGETDDTVGWNLLQQAVHRVKNTVGFNPGVQEWSGMANTFYFVDRERGVGAVVTTQSLPANNPKMLDLKNRFFKAVLDHVDSSKTA